MISRRAFIGGASAAVPLFALPGALGAQGTAPRLHAIVVGINLYTGLTASGRKVANLRGCQNDAADIERAVRRYRPATLVRLGWDAAANTDEPVTRAEFFRTWEQTLAAAGRGDTLLLTYAGHGSRIPVLPGNPSGEDDGLDDTLVLTRWDASQGRSGEHIIDDELNVMFTAANARGVNVCFVADSCHSGTLTRQADPLTGGPSIRYVPDAPLATREPVPPGFTPPPPLPNLVFIAGALETQTVPEILDRSVEPHQHRGALSMAFARALNGGAVTDGVVRVRDLLVYVLRNTRLLTEGNQTPNIRRPTMVTASGLSDASPLFVLRSETPPPEPPPPGMIRLRIHGRSAADAERIVRTLRGVALAGAGQGEALTWDGERRIVLNSQGDRIAEKVGETDLQAAVDCLRALDRLRQMTAREGLEVLVLKGGADGRDTPASDGVQTRLGEILGVRVTGLVGTGYLAAFNVTGSGLVQMLEPTPMREGRPHPDRGTGLPFSGAEKTLRGAEVGAPFGLDYIVAVAGRQPLTRLMPALVAAHKQADTEGVMKALEAEAQAQPLRIGLRWIFSARP